MIVISPSSMFTSLSPDVFIAKMYRDQNGDYVLQIVNSREGSTFYFSTPNPETFRYLCGSLAQAAQDGFEMLPRLEDER